jgi:hypothetical protein
MLTILATDGQPGLQVHLGGRWVDVPPAPGCFVCNLGDMLERWGPGVWRVREGGPRRRVPDRDASAPGRPIQGAPEARSRLLTLPLAPGDTHPALTCPPLPPSWTNGLYRSTLHRVVTTSGRERFSIPFFFEVPRASSTRGPRAPAPPRLGGAAGVGGGAGAACAERGPGRAARRQLQQRAAPLPPAHARATSATPPPSPTSTPSSSACRAACRRPALPRTRPPPRGATCSTSTRRRTRDTQRAARAAAATRAAAAAAAKGRAAKGRAATAPARRRTGRTRNAGRSCQAPSPV